MRLSRMLRDALRSYLFVISIPISIPIPIFIPIPKGEGDERRKGDKVMGIGMVKVMALSSDGLSFADGEGTNGF